MKHDQWFCLSWKNIGSQQNQVFNDLWQEGELIDVTIICKDKTFYAHRIILSASSTYFRQSFKNLPANNVAVLLLPSVHPDDLESILHFIYCGEVSVQGSRLKPFLAAASDLKINGLCNEIFDQERIIEDPISEANDHSENIFHESEIINLDAHSCHLSNKDNLDPVLHSFSQSFKDDSEVIVPKEEILDEVSPCSSVDFPLSISHIPLITYEKKSSATSVKSLPHAVTMPNIDEVETTKVTEDSENSDLATKEFNPLPQFSPMVIPFLEGRITKHFAYYSSKVKDEVIAHLRKYPSISKASYQDRKKYLYEIGKCMRIRFPNLPWDPAPSQKKRIPEDDKYPWTYFMNKTMTRWSHLIQKNTLVDVMNTCRKKQLMEKASYMSPTEALKTLNEIEAKMRSGEQFEIEDIESCLVPSFPLRKLYRNSIMPIYFKIQHILESEAILIFDQGLCDIEVQLYISVIKVKDIVQGDTILNVQDFLTENSNVKPLNMESSNQNPIPGPTLYYNEHNKTAVIRYNSNEHISVKGGILRSTCLLVALYDILGLSYPSSYAQTLAFVEYCIMKKCSLDPALQSSRLRRLKNLVEIDVTGRKTQVLNEPV